MAPAKRVIGRLSPALVSLTVLVLLPALASADGWHNAALATSSLDQWLDQNFSDLKSQVPDFKQKLAGEVTAGRDYQALEEKAKAAQGNTGTTAQKGKTGPGKAGTIMGKFNPQQQALMGKKAADCMEILGCMNPDNIFPHEFPQFQMTQIPRYRDTAKQLLKMMGPTGAQAVAAQLRSELMGSSAVHAQGLKPAATYYQDLLDLLRVHMASGNFNTRDIKDLMDAAAGQKNGPQQALAREIQKALDLDLVPIATLIEWGNESTDSKSRLSLFGKVRARIKEATLPELLSIARSKADTNTKDVAAREMEKRWKEARPLELMVALEEITDPQMRKTALAALAEKTPTYAEVKNDIAEMAARLKSQDTQIAAAAHEQLVNAFLRAPIPECLDWLARGDANLDKLIWEQIDDRIGRADAERKASYRDAALEVAKNANAGGARGEALAMLSRLKDRQAAGPLIDLVPLLPQDLRPKAGKTLRDITGQNFGPNPGDGTVEVGIAVKKWRDWWKANGGK